MPANAVEFSNITSGEFCISREGKLPAEFSSTRTPVSWFVPPRFPGPTLTTDRFGPPPREFENTELMIENWLPSIKAPELFATENTFEIVPFEANNRPPPAPAGIQF